MRHVVHTWFIMMIVMIVMMTLSNDLVDPPGAYE